MKKWGPKILHFPEATRTFSWDILHIAFIHRFSRHKGPRNSPGSSFCGQQSCFYFLIPTLARSRGATPDAFDKTLVDFPNEPLGDRAAIFEILGDERECLPVVEQFRTSSGLASGTAFPSNSRFGLLQGQARPFDVRGVVGFQNQGTSAHLAYPMLGQSSCFQELSM